MTTALRRGTAPEALSDKALRAMQKRITETRPGPWEITLDDGGAPAGFGPFSWVEPWDADELVPALEFCSSSRRDMSALLGEVARLKNRVIELEHGPALRWAAHLDADDLEGFLEDLALAASGDDDLSTLQSVEKAIATWRGVAAAQLTHGSAPGPAGEQPMPSPLTRQMKVVLIAVARGERSRETAERLHLSVHTVRTHRRRILRALGVQRGAQAVGVACLNGWLTAHDITAPEEVQ